MVKERITPPQDKGLVSFEESCRKARELLTKYQDQITAAHFSPIDPGLNALNSDRAIQHFLHQFPDEVLEEFVAHGISKHSEVHILGAFLNVVENRAIKGDSDRLVHGPRTHIPAYTRSPFLILSHYKKPLADLGPDGRPRHNAVGLQVNVGAFVVNNDYYPLVDELRTMFPGVNIVRANELPAYISAEIERDKSLNRIN